jgi:hypothetical protein
MIALAGCAGSSKSAAPKPLPTHEAPPTTTTPDTVASTATTTPPASVPAATTPSTKATVSTTVTTQLSFSGIAGAYIAGTADGGSLYIRSDGASRFRGPDPVACPACSTATSPIATLDFTLRMLRSTSAGASWATGTITAESDAAWAAGLGSGPRGAGPVGSAMSLTVAVNGALTLSFLPANDVLRRS